MIYRHESMIPFDSLDSEDGLKRHLYMLRSIYIRAQGCSEVVRDPVTRSEYGEKDFLLAALKGSRFAIVSKSEEKAMDKGGVLLHTADLAKAVGKWDEAIKREPYSCKHRSNATPPTSVSEASSQFCPDMEKICYAAGSCREKRTHYENRRFGEEKPKPLAVLVDEALAKDFI